MNIIQRPTATRRQLDTTCDGADHTHDDVHHLFGGGNSRTFNSLTMFGSNQSELGSPVCHES